MVRIKLNYMLKGTNCVETIECNTFSPGSIITALERKIQDQTGEEMVVSSLHERWTEGDVLLFSFDCEGDVMSGFAYQSKVKTFVYGIWLEGNDPECSDPDELYETDECDESAVSSYFIQLMDLDMHDMDVATIKLISAQA